MRVRPGRSGPRHHFLPALGAERVIKIPAVVSLSSKATHRALTAKLGDLRQAFREGGGRICVDFSETRSLMPEGMLLLYSELHMLAERFPNQPLRCVPSNTRRVSQVLQHLGIYKKLGYSSGLTIDREDVNQWQTCHSDWVDVEQAGQMIEGYESYMAFTREQSKLMFRGVSEAITNVKNHAYSRRRKDGLHGDEKQNWWMFCRESDDALYLCVCDLGIGIPRSLPPAYTREVMARVLSEASGGRKPHDGTMIAAAVELSRSRTLLANRGKGFRDMLSLAEGMPGSQFTVLSNRGLYMYKHGRQKTMNFRDSILGTIVIWRLPGRSGTNVGQ